MRSGIFLCPSRVTPELAPIAVLQRLDFGVIFGRVAPTEIDLGCGSGNFLAQLAQRTPESNFLGIERLNRRVAKTCAVLARLNLTNARVLRFEAAYAVRHLVSPDTVSAFHLLFPDPWPKRRHHGRRVFTGEFLASIYRALCAGGLLHIATDDSDYFREVQRISSAGPPFATVTEAMTFPVSLFEEKTRANSADVYRLLLRKVSPVR